MAGNQPRILPGRSYPLGATWDGRGVNFALFSAHAEKVELCLFERTRGGETGRIVLPECTDQVWHGYLPDARPGTLYGYRVYGPYQPENGHRFNHHKLLLDPYARLLRGRLRWSDAHFGYRVGSNREDLSFDRRDNAYGMPKCEVVDPSFRWGDDRPPARPWDETLIYEAHLRGFTMRHPALKTGERGTAAGMAARPVIQYLRDLGISAIELLPIHAYINDRYLVDRHLSNYWGYNTIGFFAPESRYLATGQLYELKTMIARLHDAGLEVILDVVYNHTAEGNHLGPTLSFRGIDNCSYYHLQADAPRYYADSTGTGNTLDVSHPRVLQMVMDSLRYWVGEMHVDGFRFDLASAVARGPEGFDRQNSFLDAVRQDPVLARVKLIAEPWDLGPGGYQLGNYGPGWAEWNDRFRDAARRFWRGDQGQLPEFATRLTGSADLFDHDWRRPWASINFVTSHDGFTLHDLVSYERKHNEANGEDNRDGRGDALSASYGVEGPTDDPEIRALRRRQSRNLMATLLLSQGTPMMLAGDELGRTQQGNNNAYCQDNELSWLDWENLDDDGGALIAFAIRVIRLRIRHPILRWPRFLHGQDQCDNGIRNITWLTPGGTEPTPEWWQESSQRCIGLMLNGNAQSAPTVDPSLSDEILLLLFNANPDKTDFVLPRLPVGIGWFCLLDTAREKEIDMSLRQFGEVFDLDGRSIAVLQLTVEQ